MIGYKLVVMEKNGRIMIPREFRGSFLSKLKVVRQEGQCLFLLTEEEWSSLQEKKLSGLKGANLRRANRILFGAVFEVEMDRQGRIIIPKSLRKLESLEGRAIIVKTSDRLEIWREEKWQERMKKT